MLAREGILGDEGGRATHEVGERSRHDGLLSGFGRGEQALPERASKRSPALGTLAEQANPHRGLLIAYRGRQRDTREYRRHAARQNPARLERICQTANTGVVVAPVQAEVPLAARRRRRFEQQPCQFVA